MSKRDVKWTQELRRIVFARLVMEFGPYSDWELVRSPADTKRYKAVLQELSSYISDITGETFKASAIDQQVNWAVTNQTSIKNTGFAYQYVMNKSAALEVGLIASSTLNAFSYKPSG